PAPERRFILAANESLYVEAEHPITTGPETESPKGNPELCAPAERISGCPDVPNPVPVFISVIHPGKLGIPHRPVGIGAKEEAATMIVKAVDKQCNVVVDLEIGVSPELGGPNPGNIGVIGAYPDIERLLIPGHLHDRSFG